MLVLCAIFKTILLAIKSHFIHLAFLQVLVPLDADIVVFLVVFFYPRVEVLNDVLDGAVWVYPRQSFKDFFLLDYFSPCHPSPPFSLFSSATAFFIVRLYAALHTAPMARLSAAE